MKSQVLLFAIALVIGAVKGKRAGELPKITNCNQENEVFHPSKTYNYKYEVNVKAVIPATSKEETRFKLACDVQVNGQEDCRNTLKVNKCSLEGKAQNEVHLKSEEFSTAMQRYSVEFSMADGSVHGLLAHTEEPTAILNVKRGIISAFTGKKSVFFKMVKDIADENHEEDMYDEMRTDVHGTCPVFYVYHKGLLETHKDINNCHFPSRVDWPYSPGSLLWNTSFITRRFVKSRSECKHTFNGEHLNSTECNEYHTLWLEYPGIQSPEAAGTTITQRLKLVDETSLIPVVYDKKQYHLTGIQFEYEKIVTPNHNPPNLKENVSSMLQQLLYHPEKPIDHQLASTFDDLIQLLRKSSDLSVIKLNFPKCWKSPDCSVSSKNIEIQQGSVWVDALIQCNRAPCIRAFRTMLSWDKDYMQRVLSEVDLDLIFQSWAEAKIASIDMVEEIYEIAKTRPYRRFPRNALASIAHSFYMQNGPELTTEERTVIEKVIQFITLPINERGFPSEGFDSTDVIAALQAVANIGNLYQATTPDYLEKLELWIYNYKTSFSLYAIQTTRRMDPSTQLYDLLIGILKTRTLEQETVLLAYYVLTEKFGNAKLVDEILPFLRSHEKTGENNNIRTFIVTHMRAVAKSRDQARAKYADAIREAMINHPNLFRAIPEEHLDIGISIDNPKRDDYYDSKSIPWDLHLDDDLVFDKGYFSKYHEAGFKYAVAPLPDAIKRFGYTYLGGILHKEGSFLPYLLFLDDTVQLFGKSFNLSHFSINTLGQGFSKLGPMLTKFWEANDFRKAISAFNYKEATSRIFEQLKDTEFVKELQLKFPYKIDEKILQNLKTLHAKNGRLIPTLTYDRDTIYQFGFLNEFKMAWTLEEMMKLNTPLKEWIYAQIRNPYKSNSLYWKALEAATEMPTLAGLPQSWTTDVFIIANSRFDRAGNSFSGLATLKQRMQVELPGFTSCGAQFLSTVSTSVGGTFDASVSFKDKTYSASVELPLRPMQLISMKRTISLIQDFILEDLPETMYKEYRKKETWCSYKLASIMGIKVCHKSSYVDAARNIQMPCYSHAGNAYWEYATEVITKNKIVHQMNFNMLYGDENTTYNYHVDADIRRRETTDTDVKYNTLLKFSNEANRERSVIQTQITMPTLLPSFNITILNKYPEDGGRRYFVQATVYPGSTRYLDYVTKTTLKEKSEDTMKGHLNTSPSSETVTVPVTESTFNYTTPYETYHYINTFQRFPTTSYSDFAFSYKKFDTTSTEWSWFQTAFRHSSCWETPHTGWAKIRRESRPSANDGEHYIRFKLPHTVTKVQTLATRPKLSLNVTKHDAHTGELLTYANFTITTTAKPGGNSAAVKASAMTTWANCETELFAVHDFGNPPKEYNITLTTRLESLALKSNAHALPWWVSDPHVKLIQLGFYMKFPETPEPIHLSPFSGTTLGKILRFANNDYALNYVYHRSHKPGADPTFQIDFQTVPTYHSLREMRHKRDFSLRIPTMKFHYDAKLSLDFSVQTEFLLWKATIDKSEDRAYYSFNISYTPMSEMLYVTEDLHSKIYTRNSRLKMSLYRLTSNPNLELNITAAALIKSPLFVDFRLKIADKIATLKMLHLFAELDASANWQKGFQGTAIFKTGDMYIVPNMLWKVDYPNPDNGVTIVVRFPDIHKAFYVFAKTKLDATRLVFDFCHQRNCTSSNADSDDFVAEIELSLEDPQQLTRTVSYNRKILERISISASHRASSIVWKLQQAISQYQPNRPEHQPALKMITDAHNAFLVTFREIQSIRKPYGNIAAAFIETIRFPLEIVAAVGETIASPFVGVYQNLYYRCRYQPASRVYTKFEQLSEMFSIGFYQPGPVPGRSYVSRTPLPVYWTHFNKPPVQLSPTFARNLQASVRAIDKLGNTYLELYNDREYKRQALFFATGDIYTFEGRFMHLQGIIHSGCSYLLTHDVQNGKFSVYYQNSHIHLLFPDLSLDISSTGQVLLNESLQLDLPYQNWNGNIRAIRKEHLIKLTTPYHFKVICNVKDFYCLFYTDEFKFNQLTGLLGNNNDNPADETRDVMKFELTGDGYCRNSKYLPPPQSHNKYSSSTFQFKWKDFLWQTNSCTLRCHDHVSPKEFFFYPYIDSPPRFPCSVVNGYLSLCGAKGVPVGRSPCLYCGEHYWGEHWKSKIDGAVEVIFVIDQTNRLSSKNFYQNVKALAESIATTFQTNDFKNVSFGLVGFCSRGNRRDPHQHTMNGKLLGTLDEFENHGLKTLVFDGHYCYNKLDAIEFAAEHYSLSGESAHVLIVMTPDDVRRDQPDANNVLEAVKQQSLAVHVFSKSLSSGGQHATIANPSGDLWQMHRLEDDHVSSSEYLQTVSAEILKGAKAAALKERRCNCYINQAEQPLTYCDYI